MPITSTEKNDLINFIDNSPYINIKHTIGWQNFSRNLKEPSALVLDIQDISSLQAIKKEIYRINQSKSVSERIIARTVAGGRQESMSESFSFTNGEGDIFLRLVGKDFRKIEHGSNENILRVGAGVQLVEIDEGKHDKVLPTASMIGKVTVAGSIANSVHGTGPFPSVCGLVKSVTLCLENGDIETIKEGDKLFNMMRGAHIDLFGTVIETEMSVIEAQKAECLMEVKNLEDFKKDIENHIFHNEKYPYVSAMLLYTYPDAKVLVYRFRPVDINTKSSNSYPEWNHIMQKFETTMADTFSIQALLKYQPWITPYYIKYLLSYLIMGFKDSVAIGNWGDIFHYQTAFPHNLNDTSWLFESNKDNDKEILQALETWTKTLDSFAKKGLYPQVLPTYIRVFDGLNDGLSSSQHREGYSVCGFDIISCPGIKAYETYRDAMSQAFIDMGGKPHWGKYIPFYLEGKKVDYQQLYGTKLDEFNASLKEWFVSHNMSLEKSFSLSNFACNILNLPEYKTNSPDPVKEIDHDKTPPDIDFKQLARDLLATIDSSNHHPDVINFKKCLEKIINENVAAKQMGLYSVAAKTPIQEDYQKLEKTNLTL